ncbi:LOW QUALITY PROTEIN: NACHT, LRR and PYD domains-containing protein 12-like [Colossoma macropomum]|uniref:LOW QUALITY PROTEIN: NACHT, LRR and PYD domains-containing protein 12-like n=1 Tax=Colossoma macropomum TaxID=42526 RepID=UPI0018649DFA|nr:LOW QUALITY PROTEIN: NACHT, LRR and PYD domains-containing protein 12-like [Colossoma macropomum]
MSMEKMNGILLPEPELLKRRGGHSTGGLVLLGWRYPQQSETGVKKLVRRQKYPSWVLIPSFCPVLQTYAGVKQLYEKEVQLSASKMDIHGKKDESDEDAQLQRSVSPLSSCVSMKSGHSMSGPVFRDDGISSDQRDKPPRSVSPVSSCVSMKSDQSLIAPPMFGGDGVSSDKRDKPPRSVSPVSSCVSMKSDQSLIAPPTFSGDGVSSDKRDKPPRSVSPVSSCVSMKSDQSLIAPPMFGGDGVSSDKRDKPQRSASPVSSCVSMKSDQSLIAPPMFGGPSYQNKEWCGMCGQLLKDPASITCGHSFCRQCINSYWEHSDPSGGFACPQCRKRSKTRPVLLPQKAMEKSMLQDYQLVEDVLHRVLEKHKTSMKMKFECLFEGIRTPENKILLNIVYTQLYIIEGESEGVNEQHEVLQIERALRCEDTPINCNDIFKPFQKKGFRREIKEKSMKIKHIMETEGRKIRVVMTKGIAGIGKTVSVQKFILDWADGKANQDVDFMFVLPFREVNLIKDDKYSLHGLLCDFYPELKELDSTIYDLCKVVFVFDGMDESRISLKFQGLMGISDPTTSLPVSVLMTKLIKGDLLPSAHVWITSRPAAASQIPSQYIDRVTEIQGFNDEQKQEYFRKRIKDQDQASRIISHIKITKSLYVMCYMPVFCWISATVLQILDQNSSAEIPKTLTEMYAHFLLTQTTMKNQKYNEGNERNTGEHVEQQRDVILKLAELAFEQLMKGNALFYEEDLKECGIDATEASVYSGICTEIFREESVLYQKKVFCFVHMSFQEFMAAFYVFYGFKTKNMDVLQIFKVASRGRHCRDQSKQQKTWSEGVLFEELIEGVVYKAFKSQSGHLNLFLRFLLGISLESNQRLLQAFLMHVEHSTESVKRTIQFIKDQIQKENLPAERSINMFLCLLEMNDQSLYKEIQEYLQLEKRCEKKLSPIQCSALACMLLMSEKVLEELDLKKYNTSREGCRRLVQAVGNSRKALIAGCNLTAQSFETVASALQLPNSPLKELDLSNNDLLDSGMELLSAGLKSSHCKLEILRLAICKLTEKSCETMASILQLENSGLRDLDLSNNDLQDSGVKLLSAGLKSSHCKLQILRLSGCLVTDEGCSSLASALKLNPSHLRELDLSYNKPRESGIQLLSDLLKDPHCELVTLNTANEMDWIKEGLQKYSCKLTMNPNTACKFALMCNENKTVTHVENPQSYLDDLERFEYWEQVVSVESMGGRCYWEAEWSGEVAIAVTYRGISRKGRGYECVFGHNEKSWRLSCSNISYSAKHNKKSSDIIESPSRSDRIGVYLDWLAGTLSFYSVSADNHTLTHLHTFYAKFTEPLYAGFGFYNYYSTVSLCQTDKSPGL